MFRKHNQLEKGIGLTLPVAYKKFFEDWKFCQPKPVHYIPKQSTWKRNESESDNKVLPLQDIPLPLQYPSEYHKQLWGGEGILQGFTKKRAYNRRNPMFWIPTLHRSVIYSEILDKYMSVVLTERALHLINSNYGFDHYVLKTAACDLKSLLALGLKRKMLQDLYHGCPTYAKRPEKQKEVLQKYQIYLSKYTFEEIQWYGYSFQDACDKWLDIQAKQRKELPLKLTCREDLNRKLRDQMSDNDVTVSQSLNVQSWFMKINPFLKKEV